MASEVYRAYIRPDQRLTPLALERLRHAFDLAVDARPDLRVELEHLLDLAKAEDPADVSGGRLRRTAPADLGTGDGQGRSRTPRFYRWHRLVALNEVGGDPAVVEHADPAVLHDWAARQQRDWPRGMTTLSTHDTKRSEDVRARLLAVAEDTASWRACSRAFATAADAAAWTGPPRTCCGRPSSGSGRSPRERLHGYLTKAMREAKRHTGWLAANEEYEARVQAFADSAVADGDLHEAVASAVRENLPGIRAACWARSCSS